MALETRETESSDTKKTPKATEKQQHPASTDPAKSRLAAAAPVNISVEVWTIFKGINFKLFASFKD
jgi:hypothetical protein